ncbi:MULTISPECIES: hypothetical protein [Actinoplanes]|uniref:hypothetical protein n=1 Tax=Actinoplanes TaxID=1865 RepID=UPI0005F2B999|nr:MULTISPECIES: hypothetical protein [Actinoplanes]GLY04907.1 hypothetical protein Acsp01_52860 [Actinoplanes sp. NBRC 101535]
MNTIPRIHRAAAVAAGVLLGLTGLVGIASPASATTTCVQPADAKYQHTFNGPAGTASIELLNGPLCAEQSFTLVSYTAPSARFATPQHVLDTSVKKFEPATAAKLQSNKLEFQVEVPQCFTQVDFVFGDTVINPLTDSSDRYGNRKVGEEGSKPGNQSTAVPGNPQHAYYNGGSGTCKAEPAVEALSDCDGNVALKLINRSTFSSSFSIAAADGFTTTEKLAARAEPKTVVIPAANAKGIVVNSGDKELYRGEWTKPEDCKTVEAPTPEASVVQACEGLGFTVTNPAEGKDLTVTFTPNKGDAQTVTVAPGKTENVAFVGSEGLKVKVEGDLDALKGEVVWTKPANCGETTLPPVTPAAETSPSPSTPAEETPSEETTPSESPSTTPVATTPVSDDESLPLTGAAAGGIAGGAALLLIVGVGLFFMARRRKVNFTA